MQTSSYNQARTVSLSCRSASVSFCVMASCSTWLGVGLGLGVGLVLGIGVGLANRKKVKKKLENLRGLGVVALVLELDRG